MLHMVQRWEPFADLNQFRKEFDRIFNDGRQRFSFADRKESEIAVSAWQSDEAVRLEANLPGINADELDLVVDERTLKIRVERPEYAADANQTVVHGQRNLGVSEKTVTFPFDISPETADARYDKGVLTVNIQRPQEQQPHKISVRRAE